MVIQVARVDSAVAVKERLERFGRDVLAEAMNRPAQMANGGLYLRGLVEEGKRKSLEPIVERLGGDADYQSMQQFLSDSPWDPVLVVKAVAERVAGEIDVEAWVLDDTGFPKQGKRSPGVKRQYSGTLGKIGNCQIGVSVHAVGARGTVPLGWALYLPEEWCEDPQRRAKAKVPEEVQFKTKLELGQELVERAGGWNVEGHRSWVMRRMARTPSFVRISIWLVSSSCSRSTRRRVCLRPRRPSRCPSAQGRLAGQGHGCVLIANPSPCRS